MDEGPEEIAEIRDPGSGTSAVPVDDRDRDHVAKDEVRLGQIPMTRDLRAGGKGCPLRQVVHVPNESRSRPYRRFGQPEAVVRRSESIDVGQDLATLPVDPEESRRSLETAALEVKEQAVHVSGVGVHRPTDGVTNPYDAGSRHTAVERHLVHNNSIMSGPS